MSDPFDYHQVQDYLTSLVPARPGEVQKMEAEAGKHGFPIIGPVCGQVCYLLARSIGAKQVFELGSGYGYSTYWFAKAVHENGGGRVHHTVWDETLSRQAQGHLAALGLDDLVTFHNAEALASLRSTPGQFDIIFNDIDKQAYPDSLPLIKEKLRSGGLLIIDNMLWHARIFDPSDTSPATLGVKRFTEAIANDQDWIMALLPIRDGMIAAYKQ